MVICLLLFLIASFLTQIQTCDLNCETCSYDSSSGQYCDTCKPTFGLQYAGSSNCVSCSVLNCNSCDFNQTLCSGCVSGYGRRGNDKCQLCSAPSCSVAGKIAYCQDKYGYNETDNICLPCEDTKCLRCASNYIKCSECQNSFGFPDGNTYELCELCNETCLTCSAFHSKKCLSCPVEKYYLQNEWCHNCPSTCRRCQNEFYCTLCVDSASMNSNMCYACPEGCATCTPSPTNFFEQRCDSCDEYYRLTEPSESPIRICVDICGDLVTINLPCDYSPNILLDGCTEVCEVEEGFECKVLNRTTVCSYNQTLEMGIISFVKEEFTNVIHMAVKISPHLYVFSQTSERDFSQIFGISNRELSITSLRYNSSESILYFELALEDDFISKSLEVWFWPKEQIDERFYASSDTNIALPCDIINHLSYIAIVTVWITPNLSYCIISLAYFCLILGVVMKKLAGIEFMIVVQFAWISVLWMNNILFVPFKQSLPLSYSMGYHLLVEESRNTQQINTQDFMTFYSSKISVAFPHNEVFKIPENEPHINIFCLIHILIGLFALICFAFKKIYLWRYSKLMNKVGLLDECYVEREVLEANLNKVLLTFESLKTGSYQVLFLFSLLNLINLINSFVLIFSVTTQITLPLVLLFFSLFISIATIILFFFDPDPFDYIRYSFKPHFFTVGHYYMYIGAIIGTVLLVMELKSNFWSCLIPFGILCLYTPAMRPYKETKENIRAILCMIVILFMLGFRVYLWRVSPETNVELTFIYFLCILSTVLFLGVITVSYLFYEMVYVWYIRPRREKTEKKEIMEELDTMKVSSKIKQVENEDNIFKKLIIKELSVLDFSNQIRFITPQKDEVSQYHQEDNSIDENTKWESINLQEGAISGRKLRKEMEEFRIDGKKKSKAEFDNSNYLKVANEKVQKKIDENVQMHAEEYIKKKEIKMRGGVEDMSSEERKEFERKSFVLELVVEENKFLGLKNAEEYTKENEYKDKNEQQYLMEYIKFDNNDER